MVQFLPQNALQAPNMNVDFSPISNAIDSNRRNALALKEDARQEQELSMRRQSHSASMADRGRENETKLAQRVAGLSQMVMNEPDPVKQQQMWGKFTSADPRIAKTLTQYGFDPNDHINGPKFIIAQARGYQDPMEARKAELQNKYLEAQIGAANQRQDQTKVMEVNGRLVRIPQSGAAEEIYNAGPNQQNAPSGYMYNQQGALTHIPGGPADPSSKPLTESQSKDAMLADRVLRSEQNIDRVAGINPDGTPKQGAYNPARSANRFFPDDMFGANMFNSKEWQQYQQSARESIAAVLRKDTGAAVTASEWDLYFPMLFPQPGDGPEVILQKKQLRERTGAALKGSSGPAYDRMFPAQPNKSNDPVVPPGLQLPPGARYIGPAQ
jgi:hypothetical protein